MVKKVSFFLIIFSLVLSRLCLPDAHAKDSGYRLKDRMLEFGFNAGFGITNNFLSLGDFDQDKLIIDLDDISGGLKINMDANITPFYFQFNNNNDWGFGLSYNITSIGNIGFSQKMIRFEETENHKPDTVGFAVFADTTVDTFFHVQDIKISVKPSMYYTLVYNKPEITYTFIKSGTPSFSLDYNARVYTAFKIDDIDDIQFDMNSFSATPGFDMSLGFVYPLSKKIGLAKNFVLFDFDIGLDLINIPIAASTMRHYVEMTGNVTMKGDTIKEFYEALDTDAFYDDDPEYGKKKKSIKRPFRTNLYVDWRLFGRELFTLTPNIGFSVNPLYRKPFSMEYGLNVKLDVANIFILTTGFNYEEKIWKNRIGMNFNFRVFELALSAEARTYDFFRVTNTSGVGAFIGLAFGF